MVGIDQMHKTVDPAFEDTGSYLEGALFIKEHGGIVHFVITCWTGEYKIANQHPLYLLLLSSVASRALVFFPMAKALTLVIGLLAVLVLFFIVRDLYGRSTAAVASVLMAFNAAFLNRATHVTVEPLVILFVLPAWYFMVKGLDDNRKWLWAGLYSGLAYMSKATGIFLLPIFCVGTFAVVKWRALKNMYFWLFFGAFAIGASPLILRNLVVFHRPFHETVNSRLPWIENKRELTEKYALSLKWREHTFAADNLPTMGSYVASHPPSVIARRLVKGFRKESNLFLECLRLSSVPRAWSKPIALLLIVLFGFGLARDQNRERGLYTLAALPIFFLPFAWYFQITGEMRWIIPLVPLILIHASVGIVQLVKYVDRWLSTTRFKLNLSDHIPETLCAILIVVGAYLAPTRKLRPLLHAVELTDDQRDLMQWFGKNVREDDAVIFRPTKRCDANGHCDDPYWGLLWYAGFKGTVVMTRRDWPIQAESLAALRAYLRKRKVSMIVIHEGNYRSPGLLADYFTYDDQAGLRQVKDLEGWRLVYRYPGKPTKFYIYRVAMTETADGGNLSSVRGIGN
jgi:hypothetical protein